MADQSTIQLAVAGDAGSFSEQAGMLYSEQQGVESHIIYATDMEGVFSRLDSGEANLGIFPVVNSQGGLVLPAFTAMGKHVFTLLDQLPMEVRQCLLVLPGTSASAITQVVSHGQALIQCQRYLTTEFPGIPLVEWDDTAKAAHDLARHTLSETTAVIAPMRSAKLYGLAVLKEDIQDMHPNITTFIIVKKK